MADVQVSNDTITITSGLSDTEDGIKLLVAGDEFPRVHITPQGEIKTGDGTEAPVVAATPDAADIAYDNTESDLTADTVQGAIDELAAAIAP